MSAANDCGAMRAAHTGIAVGSGEASIAAPFSTKQNKSIAWVPAVFRCGPAPARPPRIPKCTVQYSTVHYITRTVQYIRSCDARGTLIGLARREGRCTMAAAFSLFKYMTFHSCTQYFAMNSLYLVRTAFPVFVLYSSYYSPTSRPSLRH